MKIRFFPVLALLLAAAMPAGAADLPGRWTAEFDSPIGVQKYVYEFKSAGGVLTGQATFDHSTSSPSPSRSRLTATKSPSRTAARWPVTS